MSDKNLHKEKDNTRKLSDQKNLSDTKTTIDDSEVAKFSAIAKEWWNRNGKFKTLHDINPIRLKFVTQNIFNHFGIENFTSDIKILDIGCGGGLVSVPLAKMGASVVGLDASAQNIKIAKQYIMDSGLEGILKNLRYEHSTIEDFATKSKQFDVILALEVIEHVADIEFFLQNIASQLKEGGILIISTINRTLKALALAKIGAEYILRWLPAGTHNWKAFVKPSELHKLLTTNNHYNMQFVSSTGMKYNILKRSWYLDEKDLDVNYLICFRKAHC